MATTTIPSSGYALEVFKFVVFYNNINLPKGTLISVFRYFRLQQNSSGRALRQTPFLRSLPFFSALENRSLFECFTTNESAWECCH